MKYGFLPEGRLFLTPENQAMLSTPSGLRQAMEQSCILEAMVTRCDPEHNLWLACGPLEGFMPRQETALGIREGATREIAILSRVGKPTCFTVIDIQEKDGVLFPVLSRRRAQEQAMSHVMKRNPGDIIPATVTHMEPFGAFVDVGCGIPSMIGVEHLSISRIPHPIHRFTMGQEIYALVTGVEPDSGRLFLSHKELLGTWAENAARFTPGEVVAGYVRGTKEYGIFIELSPNLSGLAEPRPDLNEGDRVSVFIKSILPERAKIKLTVIERLPPAPAPEPMLYFHTGPRLEQWRYDQQKGATWDCSLTSFRP